MRMRGEENDHILPHIVYLIQTIVSISELHFCDYNSVVTLTLCVDIISIETSSFVIRLALKTILNSVHVYGCWLTLV